MKHEKRIVDLISENINKVNLEINEISPYESQAKNRHVYYSPVKNKFYEIVYNGHIKTSNYQTTINSTIKNIEISLEILLESKDFDKNKLHEISKIYLRIKQTIGAFEKVDDFDELIGMYHRTDNDITIMKLINSIFYDNKHSIIVRIIRFQNIQYTGLRMICKMLYSFCEIMKIKMKFLKVLKPKNQNHSFHKIKIDVSIKSICAFIYLIRKVGGVFENDNVTHISKTIANLLTTDAGNISHEYIRNQQYKPSTENFINVKNYLQKIITHIDSKIENTK